MKILTIADDEDKYLWDYYQPGRLDDIDLILAAGDLDARYLTFLVTMAHCPLLYVNGNHDHYDAVPPRGVRVHRGPYLRPQRSAYPGTGRVHPV